MKKGRQPRWRQVTFIQARRGDNQSNVMTRLSTCRIREASYLRRGFVKVIGEDLVRRMNSSGVPGWCNLPGVSGRDLKFNFCHSRNQVVQQGPLRLLSYFSRLEAFEVFIFFSRPKDSFKYCVLASATYQHKSATVIHMPENEVYWLHLYPIHKHLKFV